MRQGFGPLVILSLALKGWGPPRQQGHLWASFDFVPRCGALGNPQAIGVMSRPGPLVGHF